MTRPWVTLARASSADGGFELRQRGEEYLLTLDGRVLMSSSARRSEEALGRLGCEGVAGRSSPRVLVAGLGMGFTLRAALDALPQGAEVVVAELHDAVVDWCRGPLRDASADALADARVALRLVDVREPIRTAAAGSEPPFDAILLDLHQGPHPAGDGPDHPHYGRAALAAAHRALTREGVLGIWSEDPDAAFVRALERAGFRVRVERPGRGGRRHAVYLARASEPGSPRRRERSSSPGR